MIHQLWWLYFTTCLLCEEFWLFSLVSVQIMDKIFINVSEGFVSCYKFQSQRIQSLLFIFCSNNGRSWHKHKINRNTKIEIIGTVLCAFFFNYWTLSIFLSGSLYAAVQTLVVIEKWPEIRKTDGEVDRSIKFLSKIAMVARAIIYLSMLGQDFIKIWILIEEICQHLSRFSSRWW